MQMGHSVGAGRWGTRLGQGVDVGAQRPAPGPWCGALCSQQALSSHSSCGHRGASRPSATRRATCERGVVSGGGAASQRGYRRRHRAAPATRARHTQRAPRALLAHAARCWRHGTVLWGDHLRLASSRGCRRAHLVAVHPRQRQLGQRPQNCRRQQKRLPLGEPLPHRIADAAARWWLQARARTLSGQGEGVLVR